MGTITWEEFVVGVRHILAVSDSIGDGWHFRGSLEEHGGGYLARRMDYPVAIGEPSERTLSARVATIDHDSVTEPYEIDPCSIDPDSSFRPVYGEFHVLYSLAHAVPTLYLRAWRRDGSCLEAEELWRDLTAAERRPSSDESERLRTLTQQEHPFLGEPWYHLHPCRTADMMDQIAGNDVGRVDAKVAPPRSRDEVYSRIVRLPEMEMVRAFTTRLPVVGATGTTLQRNITIYVLVAGIAGGLLLILAILLLCKYCSRLRSRTNRGENTANPVVSGWGTEVSVALTSGGISKVQHRLTSGNNNNKSSTASNATGAVLTTTLSPVSSSPAPLASSTAGHQHLTNIGSSASISPSPIIKDDLSDSYVIQVEPIRVMATSPSSILGGADSWASDESPTTHRGLLTVNEELDGWSRRIHQQSVEESVTAGTNDSLSVSPVVSKSTESHRRSLRHAATHDDGSANSSAVSKRRLDWRNSHRNYRSAPTAAASRDSYALNYDTRRALRNYHQRSIEAASAYPAASANRRVLHKRGGSMREPLTDSLDASRSSSTAAVVELTSAGSCLASTGVAQQQHPRCQMMASPATKRWRCHTVDCPCSNNVTASAVNKDLILVDGSLTAHRHSFPSSGDLLASPSSSSSNRRRNYQQHRSEDQHRRTKESLYDGYLNRSESLDWAGFQTRNKAMTSTKRDEPTSVITDIDGTGSQLQSSSAGQVPRITIRYNDPGSLESVNEDNLFFCLEAGSKNEFRQRLEKTIDAQYRQVWELRANLEEHNGFYEPSSPEPEAIANTVTSDVESFDSNSESLASEEEEIRTRNTYALNPPNQDVSATCETKLQSPTTMLHPPMSSGSWKRQSYRSVSMNSRLPRQTGPISPLQKSPQQHPQSSFDSIDTIETSSTEPSRMDQVTTSFESSATDSTNGLEVTSIQPSVSHHRMLALRNDSGYRSLESAVVPVSGSTKTATNARISLSEDDLIDPQSTDAACQCKSQVLHDEMCERQKPIVFARCTRYGMKVRSASTSAPHSSSQSLGWKHQQRLHQHHSHQSLTRDYSIDERTDALFREFSRCDPVFDSSCMKNVGGGSRPELQTTGLGHRSRWINQHQRHDAQHHYQHRFISSDASESLLQHCSLKE